MAFSDQPAAEHLDPDAPRLVTVWDWPLRVWHWALAVLVIIAWVTPNAYDGLHRVAGYGVISLVVFRLAWGFLGTPHARFAALPAKLCALPAFLRGIWRSRANGPRSQDLGLNPAGAAMLVAMMVLLAVSSITGVMHTTVTFFGVWWVEDTHTWCSDAVMVLALVHVAGSILMSVLQRENLVRAMVTGRKRKRG